MDGVSECKDIVKRAMKWGHKAIAITDHGDVQAFPDANHALSPDDDFKVIYGVEAYLVDDLKDIITDSKGQSLDEPLWCSTWRRPVSAQIRIRLLRSVQ